MPKRASCVRASSHFLGLDREWERNPSLYRLRSLSLSKVKESSGSQQAFPRIKSSQIDSLPNFRLCAKKNTDRGRVTEIKEMDLMIRALEPLPDLVIIEQLQDLYRLSKSGNAVNDSEAACCRLKSLAQETHIAVLLLSQMSRAVERRKYHVPRPEDILQWQHIKKHLDTVCVFYRDGYYEIASNNIVSATFIIRPSTSCCGTVFSKWDVNRHCIVPLL